MYLNLILVTRLQIQVRLCNVERSVGRGRLVSKCWNGRHFAPHSLDCSLYYHSSQIVKVCITFVIVKRYLAPRTYIGIFVLFVGR